MMAVGQPGPSAAYASTTNAPYRRALFMVDALTRDELVREAPAIVGCDTPSALAHAAKAPAAHPVS